MRQLVRCTLSSRCVPSFSPVRSPCISFVVRFARRYPFIRCKLPHASLTAFSSSAFLCAFCRMSTHAFRWIPLRFYGIPVVSLPHACTVGFPMCFLARDHSWLDLWFSTFRQAFCLTFNYTQLRQFLHGISVGSLLSSQCICCEFSHSFSHTHYSMPSLLCVVILTSMRGCALRHILAVVSTRRFLVRYSVPCLGDPSCVPRTFPLLSLTFPVLSALCSPAFLYTNAACFPIRSQWFLYYVAHPFNYA